MSSGDLDVSEPEIAKKVEDVKKNIGLILGFLDGILGGMNINERRLLVST